MKLMKLMIAVAISAGTLATTLPPTPAQARHDGALIGGLVAGAVIGGAIASSNNYYRRPKVYYGPACGYYPYPPCAPVYVAPPPPPPYYYGRRYY